MDTQGTGAQGRRVLALWLPHLAAERAEADAYGRGTDPCRPFAVWRAVRQRQVIAAANATARTRGVAAGMVLADARAIAPGLVTATADARADARALARLAAWCRRFSPWTAPFGGLSRAQSDSKNTNGLEDVAGIWLEVTGCAHLFGGEEAMARAVAAGLARAGFTALAGLAGTPGAAWALARTRAMEGPAVCPSGGEREALAAVPVAALRLDPAIVEGLAAVGLRRIGDLCPFLEDGGRAGLARRFPPSLLARLDAALGRTFEPISPIRPAARHAARLESPEPMGSGAAAPVAERLTRELCALLARDGLGVRRLALSAFRCDGRRTRVCIGTARPVADAAALTRLLALKLDHLDVGPGADAFALEALAAEPLHPVQGRLAAGAAHTDPNDTARALAPLIDRLTGRLGANQVGRLTLRPNHLPERAQGFVAAVSCPPAGRPEASGATIPPLRPMSRPVRLLERPELVEALSEVPDGPPAWFRRHRRVHRVARAEGPERIALDWWTLPGWQANPEAPGQPPALGAAIRDYWRVEDTAGRRFWLYRAGLHRPGAPARWYLHGVFP